MLHVLTLSWQGLQGRGAIFPGCHWRGISCVCLALSVLSALQVLALSRQGLQGRGKAEESFLAPLDAMAFDGLSHGDRLRERYSAEWQQSVDPVYCDEYTY